MRVRVIDIETSGTEPPAPPASGICELGWCDVVSTTAGPDQQPLGWEVQGPPQSVLINPGCPIPPEVSAVHHIIDEDVAAAPQFLEAAFHILADASVDLFAAHNAKFERTFISDQATAGRKWLCSYKLALRLWKDEPHHSNQALRYSRKPAGLDRAIANVAHRAGPDAYVTAFHLRDMLNEGHKIEHLVARSYQPALLITCHIGKERGKKWSEVDSGFLNWMLDKDFDEDALFTARYWLEQRRKAAAGEATDDNH